MSLLSAAKCLCFDFAGAYFRRSFRVNQGDNSYMIYASTENLKCFECGDLGHKRFLCPHKDNQRPSTSRGDVNDANHSIRI